MTTDPDPYEAFLAEVRAENQRAAEHDADDELYRQYYPETPQETR